jgi:hypothetical protein
VEPALPDAGLCGHEWTCRPLTASPVKKVTRTTRRTFTTHFVSSAPMSSLTPTRRRQACHHVNLNSDPCPDQLWAPPT